MSIDKLAQYRLKLEECDVDHSTVRLGSGAGPRFRRVWRNLYVDLKQFIGSKCVRGSAEDCKIKIQLDNADQTVQTIELTL